MSSAKNFDHSGLRGRLYPLLLALAVAATVWTFRQPAHAGTVYQITISRSRFPEVARHIDDAQVAGKPKILTIPDGSRIELVTDQ